MSKLTSERVNGIKQGYGSPFTKEVCVQRLGQIEAKAPALIEQACELCHYPYVIQDQEELEEKCRVCPLNYLDKLIAGEYPAEL